MELCAVAREKSIQSTYSNKSLAVNSSVNINKTFPDDSTLLRIIL